jgi:hypothetical protein
MLKIAEMKLSSCRLKVADIRKNCDCGIAELRLRSNISLKSCGIAIAEVFPSSCGIAIADSKKSCACPPLLNTAKHDDHLKTFNLILPYHHLNHSLVADILWNILYPNNFNVLNGIHIRRFYSYIYNIWRKNFLHRVSPHCIVFNNSFTKNRKKNKYSAYTRPHERSQEKCEIGWS